MELYQDSLKKISTIVDKLTLNKDKMMFLLETKQISELNEFSYLFLRDAESLTNVARLLPVNLYIPNAKEKVVEIIEEMSDIKYSLKDNIFEAKLPLILPKKDKYNSSFIRATIRTTLEKFILENKIKTLEGKYVIVFKHLYTYDDRSWRDHDNMEVKTITDVLALLLLKDDSGKQLMRFECSQKGNIDQTIIYLVPSCKFLDFIGGDADVSF